MQTIRNIISFFRIVFILARYRVFRPENPLTAALPFAFFINVIPAHPEVKGLREGECLAKALAVMGPSFIKLGQTLSTRADVVGDDIAADLAMLRDKLPPFPAAKAHEIIETELGKPLNQLFSFFEDTSVAAASIAQVHKAITVEGRHVAVKILRPGIEKAFARDIALFLWIARMIETLRPSLRRLKPMEVMKTFQHSVRLEMDLRFEAAAASELKENCRDDEGFYVPEVDWQRTSHRILTLEWVDGIPIDNRDALVASGHDPAKLAGQLAIIFFNQAYRDGYFHADLHPGNLFVNAKGDIVPVDFGIMGRLDKQTKIYVAEILRGFLKKDYQRVAQVHFTAGYVPSHQSMGDFQQACRSIGEPIVGLPLNKISIAHLLAQLFKITEDFEMETQPQLLLLQKTMVLVEGVGGILNPEANMWKLAEPWIERWAAQNLSPQAQLKDMAVHLATLVRNLPEQLNRLEGVPYCFTKEGVKLHPDTLKQLNENRSATSFWRTVAVATLIAVMVAGIVASIR